MPTAKLPEDKSIVPEVRLMLPEILLAVPTIVLLPELSTTAVLVAESVPPPMDTVPLERAPTPEPARAMVPLFNVVPPVNVLAPERVKVPLPLLVRAPSPEITPA